MKKLISILIMLAICSHAFAANQWYQGSNTAPLIGTTKINDIDTASQNYAFDPLDRLLSNYQRNMALVYASASTLTASAGEVVVADSSGNVKLMLKNTAGTTVTWAMIDTGAEAPSTTYYVYAKATTTADTTAGYVISTNATTPSGVTYYKKLGSFYNNADSNIASIINDNNSYGGFGSYSSKTVGATYQATTDGFVVSNVIPSSADSLGYMNGYTDGSSTPTTLITSAMSSTSGNYGRSNGFCMPVRKGDYWKTTLTTLYGTVPTTTLYWIPNGN